MAQGTRDTRMATLHTFYGVYKSGVLSSDEVENIAIAKANVAHSNCMLYESELPKFAAKYPAVDMEDFTKFLTETGGLKTKGHKKSSGEGTTTRLNSAEAAAERGVAEENVPKYIELVEMIYAAQKEINSLLGNARCSFAIPRNKPKEEKVTDEATA